MASRVRDLLRLQQQRFPLLVRQPATFPVGACVFAAMVEEADVVVALFDRSNGLLDEVIEFLEVGDEMRRQVVIHGFSWSGVPVSRESEWASAAARPEYFG